MRPAGCSTAELEAKDSGDIRVGRCFWLQLWVCHEQQVGKGGAKEGSVDVVVVLAAGAIAVLTKRTVHLQACKLGSVDLLSWL